jgi:hypothetical protein
MQTNTSKQSEHEFGLRLGVGDRQTECVNIGSCLKRWIVSEDALRASLPVRTLRRVHAERRAQFGDSDPSIDLPAHCPRGCHGLELPDTHGRLALASYWCADHEVEKERRDGDHDDDDP